MPPCLTCVLLNGRFEEGIDVASHEKNVELMGDKLGKLSKRVHSQTLLGPGIFKDKPISFCLL